MSEVGELIKSRRLSLGLTIEEVSAKTAIRGHIIEAMEGGNFNTLPSYVYAYGFIEKYSGLLGFDFTSEIKPLFDRECSKEFFGKSPEEVAIEKDIKPTGPKMPSSLKMIFLAGTLLLVIAVFAVVNLSRGRAPGDETVVLQTPVNVDIVTEPETVVEPDMAIESVQPEPVGHEEPFTPAVLAAKLEFSKDCWIDLTVDGGPSVQFTAKTGETKTVTFVSSFKVDIGNAAALTVKFNSQTFTNFGAEGAYIKNNFFRINKGKLEYTRRPS